MVIDFGLVDESKDISYKDKKLPLFCGMLIKRVNLLRDSFVLILKIYLHEHGKKQFILCF